MRRHDQPSISPDLVAQVAKGDRHAFSQLYDLSCSLLFTLAQRILNETDDTTELLQEVYVEIWQKAFKYDPDRGSPLSWMVTLTRSRAIDRIRAKGRNARFMTYSLDDQTVTDRVASASDLLESAANQELRSKVGKALRVLPKEQYVALELSYYEGLSHREIADRLNEPVGTIKTRIRLGVVKLRQMLYSHETQEPI